MFILLRSGLPAISLPKVKKCHTFSSGSFNHNLSFHGQPFCNVQSLVNLRRPKLSKLSFSRAVFLLSISRDHFDVCGVFCQTWIARFIFVYTSSGLASVNSKYSNFREEKNYLFFFGFSIEKIDNHSSKPVERIPEIYTILTTLPEILPYLR